MNGFSRYLLSTLLLVLAGIASAEIETVTWLHTDHLGSPLMARDAQGNTLWQEDYSPWGERLAAPSANSADIGYTGHYEEADIGLTYAQARWYDPAVGRFLSADAVEVRHAGARYFNRYTYTANNPVNYTDPDGKQIVISGTQSEVAAYNSALSKIKSSSSKMQLLVNEMEVSQNVHELRFPRPGERPHNATTGVKIDERSGVGTGSLTVMDPTKDVTVYMGNGKKQTFSPESVLVHELLGHGLDKDRGVINRSVNVVTGQKYSEESAMERANQYRNSVGEIPRSAY